MPMRRRSLEPVTRLRRSARQPGVPCDPSASDPAIAVLADVLAGHPDWTGTIEGHTASPA